MKLLLIILSLNIFFLKVNAIEIKNVDISDLSKDLSVKLQEIDSLYDNYKEKDSTIPRLKRLFKNSVVKSSVDSAKVYFIMAKVFNSLNLADSGFAYIDYAINISFKDDDRFKSILYSSKASLYTSQANYEKALYYYFKSNGLREKLKDTLLMSFNYNDIGLLYYYSGYNIKALEYLRKSNDLKEQLNAKTELIDNNINIALILLEMKKEDEALKYFYEYRDHNYKIDSTSTKMIIANYNIALAYYSKLDYEKAEKYFKKALKIGEDRKFLFGIAKVKYGLADLYTELEDYKLAKKYALDVLNMNINSIEFWGYNNINLGFIEYNFGNKDYNKYFKVVEDSLQSKPNLKLRENYLEAKIKIARLSNNYKDAYYFQLALDSVQSLLNENILQIQIADLTANKQLTENKNEMLKLQYQNDLNKEKLKQSNNFILMLILFVLVLLVMIVFIYFQNQKIAKLNSQLNTSNNTIVRFFSIISHDLRSPIGTFKMILDELENKFDVFSIEEKKSLISESNKEVNNILKLLENLLTWAKTSNGEFKLHITKFSLNGLISKLIENNSQLLSNKKINIINEFGKEFYVNSDSDMLNTILRNIFSNAIKFTKEGGSIYFNIKEDESNTLISIRDEGTGMSEVQLSKLFRIEHKISKLGTNKEQGTGLGLIIVNELVQYLDAGIEVKSTENVGTEVIIKLKKSK